MKKFLTRLMVVVTVAAAGVLAVAAPASASTQWPNCPFGQVCTWKNIDGGWSYNYQSTTPGTCINIGPGWNDNITMWKNSSSVTIHVRPDANCGGSYSAYGYNHGAYPILPGRTATWGCPCGTPGPSSFRWNNPI